jgi:predicted dehydrogenase
LCDNDAEKLQLSKEDFKIDEKNCFLDSEEFFKEKRSDALVIATQDRDHVSMCIKALELGYDILLEKPISPDAEEIYEIGLIAAKSDKIFSICHVLRYTKFYIKLKEILDSGRIGKLVHMIHSENVAYWHQAHSFVRGNWRNSKETSPMILAKCCHDMDILVYLIGSKCKTISSMGDLTFFTKENAPEGAPARCLDGCPVYDTCPYCAPKLYLHNSFLRAWGLENLFDIPDTSDESIIKALETNQYGRCVFQCDNDVVDHQTISMDFENGVTVSFTMCAFTNENTRVMRLMGTHGEIVGDFDNNTIRVRDFVTDNVEEITIGPAALGHGGGDAGLMNAVVSAVQGKDTNKSSAQESVQSHMMALAAEKSRVTGKTIVMDEFVAEIAARCKE